MEWRKCYLDVTLVPLGLSVTICYHIWLWHKVRTQPLTTIIGTNAAGRRFWGLSHHEGSTLTATISIILSLSCGLAAVISSTYTIKNPLNDTVVGSHGDEYITAIKYVTLLLFFIFSFISHVLGIRFINQVNFLINAPPDPTGSCFAVTTEYVYELLEKGFVLTTIGNQIFYAGLPVMLWICGPVLVFLSSVCLVLVLYNLDVVFLKRKRFENTNVMMHGSSSRSSNELEIV